MKNTKIFFKDTLPDFFHEAGKVLKVLFYEVLVVLVAMGILYATNFRVTIEKNVQIISPISAEK